MPKPLSDIGLVGLAVMGQNLILNMNDHGYTVVDAPDFRPLPIAVAPFLAEGDDRAATEAAAVLRRGLRAAETSR